MRSRCDKIQEFRQTQKTQGSTPTALRSIWSSWFTGVKNVISLNETFTTFIFSDSDTNKLSSTCENNRPIVTSYGCGGGGGGGGGAGGGGNYGSGGQRWLRRAPRCVVEPRRLHKHLLGGTAPCLMKHREGPCECAPRGTALFDGQCHWGHANYVFSKSPLTPSLSFICTPGSQRLPLPNPPPPEPDI